MLTKENSKLPWEHKEGGGELCFQMLKLRKQQ
jgi:hypothetical protein